MVNLKKKILEIIENYGAISKDALQRVLYRETGIHFYKDELRSVLYFLRRNNIIKREGDCYLKND